MAGPGPKKIALWRESRGWWMSEPQKEFAVTIDARGVRRVNERDLPSLSDELPNDQKPLKEDHKEEWSLRKRKNRDPLAESRGRFSSILDPRLEDSRRIASLSVAIRSDGTDQGDKKALKRTVANLFKGGYVPLHVHSGYAFGRSTVLAEEIAALAHQCECPAIAITDPHSLVGAVEHFRACGSLGIKPLIGTTVELPQGGELVLIAKTKRGYRSLSRLISECHLNEPRGFPLGSWERLEAHAEDLICLTGGDSGPLDRLLVRRDREAAENLLKRLIHIYGRKNVYLEIERSFLPWGLTVDGQLMELSKYLGLTAVAGGTVTHARREHFPSQDALVCSHTLCTIEELIGRKDPRDPNQPSIKRFPERALNAERFLKTTVEFKTLFADRPDLIANTRAIAEQVEDDVFPSRMKVPQLFDDDARALREIVALNAPVVYGPLSRRQCARLEMEVNRITKQGHASHFLVAWDMVRWAREQQIQMSGRGSVVDSAVAFVLGLSRIDAISHDLHFDRFLPADGRKRPDIDLDFESHRRDDVRGYLVGKYGVEHVAAVTAIGAFGTRGIVREVGKVFGLPNETISYFAKRIHGGVSAEQLEAAFLDRPELRDSNIPREKFIWVLKLAGRLMDIPRNMRLHSCGVILSTTPIRDTVPVMWSAAPSTESSGKEEALVRMIQWDKRSIKHYADKYDVLCLRGQDVMAGVESRIRLNDSDFSAERLDATQDPEVYRAMRSGELVGVPQSASPAMRQAHIRLRTDNLHDVSLVQAGIRPGVGGAVQLNELIARRRGKPFTYEHPHLEGILGCTYGIIVFQEQVDQLLQRFAGYTADQAEDVRDAIYKKRKEDFGEKLKDVLIKQIMDRGYGLNVAERVFQYVAGFKGYGFAQGHALAFAEISLRCVWMMQNHPAEYFAALLSAQPAGYYGPATIANEARTRGVRILPFDVSRSGAEFEVENIEEGNLNVPAAGIRVALPQLIGLSKKTRERILALQFMSPPGVRQRDLQAMKAVSYSQGQQAVATLERDESMKAALPDIRVKAFKSIFDFAAKTRPDRDELEALILAGGFDSLHANRRSLLWAIPAIEDHVRTVSRLQYDSTLPLIIPEPELPQGIEDFRSEEKVVYERAYLGLDIDRHLVAFERERITRQGGVTTAEARRLPAGSKAFAVGNPIRLRFPPTSSGSRVVFFDLEDETGLLNVTCFEDVYQRDGKAIVTHQYVTVVGLVQDRDGCPAFLATRVFPYNPVLAERVSQKLPLASADFLVG
jgi:error-prone DNA polymerase